MTQSEQLMARIKELEAKLEAQSKPKSFKFGLTENGNPKITRGRDRIILSKAHLGQDAKALADSVVDLVEWFQALTPEQAQKLADDQRAKNAKYRSQ